MPARSQAQRGLIFGKRKQYKSKAKTPDKWKWIWDEDYENKGKLPKNKNKNETVKNVVMEKLRLEDINHLAIPGRNLGYSRPEEITLYYETYMKYKDIIDSNFHVESSNGNRPEALVRVLEKNPVRENFRAKTVYESIYGDPYVSDDTRPHEPREEDEGWTLKPGEKVEFDVRGLRDEFLYDEDEEGPELVAHNRQIATIMGPETASEIGDRDAEYYNIKFDDGYEAYGVSGYHLFDI